MSRRLILVSVALLAVVALYVSIVQRSNDHKPDKPRSQVGQSYTPSTEQSSALDSGGSDCGASLARSLVKSYIAAVDGGDISRAVSLVATPGQGFMSYGVRTPIPRSGLRAYLEGRHLQGEFWILRSFRFVGVSGIVASFVLVIDRRIGAARPGNFFVYGAVVCGPGVAAKIAKWSLVSV